MVLLHQILFHLAIAVIAEVILMLISADHVPAISGLNNVQSRSSKWNTSKKRNTQVNKSTMSTSRAYILKLVGRNGIHQITREDLTECSLHLTISLNRTAKGVADWSGKGERREADCRSLEETQKAVFSSTLWLITGFMTALKLPSWWTSAEAVRLFHSFPSVLFLPKQWTRVQENL